MRPVPAPVAEFLKGKRFAVTGVSRGGRLPANAILKKLQASGYEAVPVNPNATTVDGAVCYPDLASVPGPLDGVVVASPPATGADIVGQARERGIAHVWFHRSFGAGSVAPEALAACAASGIEPIVGGCPLMYCAPVDPAHRCFRWWLRLKKRIPG